MVPVWCCSYSCSLSTATIEYSCPSVCLWVCLCFYVPVCVFVHYNSKNNCSIHLNLEHVVAYQNSSDKFDIGHCPIKVTVPGHQKPLKKGVT